MKISTCFLLLVLTATPGCKKIRDIAAKLDKKSESSAAASAGSFVTEIPDGGYDAFTRQAGKLVIVDFYADWCGPCRQLSPILDKIATESGGRVLVGKVNVDKQPELASKNGIRSIPDVRIFRDGREVDKFVGLPAESEVRRKIEAQLKGLKVASKAASKAAPTEASPSPEPTGPKPGEKGWLPPGMQRR